MQSNHRVRRMRPLEADATRTTRAKRATCNRRAARKAKCVRQGR